MKSLSTKAAQSIRCDRLDDSTRCAHHTPSGRRCKLPVEAPGQLLCYTHALALKKSDVLNLKAALLTGYQGFQTAQGINFSLTNLYQLLANNYISPRRASVLAYISSLLLRTLPAIDYDCENGHTDPSALEEALTENEPAETTNAEAPDPDTPPASAPCPDAATVWDPSIPEPDPTRKPS